MASIQVDVERAEIRMPDGPIHELGEFVIGVHLHSEVDAEITVRVVAAE
jgi:large subunit ribosomal protein L9